MTRQAKLGGDFSRCGARGPGSRPRARPNGLRALASPEVPSGVKDAALPDAAAPVGGGVHAVPAAPACPSGELANAARRLPPACPDGVTPSSRGLASARASWTVVDSYELHGKRYVVALCQEVRRPPPYALSAREREALGLALLQKTNKVIAFEMGISASTVGVLLHRARRKFGSPSRADLFTRFREMEAAAGPREPSTH